jgi:hypothetical protein
MPSWPGVNDKEKVTFAFIYNKCKLTFWRLGEATLYVKIQFAHHREQCASITKANRWKLYTEIMAVYFKNYTEQVNALWGQNVDIVNVKPGGTYSYHWALKG